jgi:hypothetical protein
MLHKDEIALKKQEWLYLSHGNREEVHRLGFHVGTPIHIIFETVFLNVALSFGLKWNDAFYARETDEWEYACRVCMMVNLYRALLSYGDINNESTVKTIMGKTNFQIVEDFLTSEGQTD